jgi:hypothetical protein
MSKFSVYFSGSYIRTNKSLTMLFKFSWCLERYKVLYIDTR